MAGGAYCDRPPGKLAGADSPSGGAWTMSAAFLSALLEACCHLSRAWARALGLGLTKLDIAMAPKGGRGEAQPGAFYPPLSYPAAPTTQVSLSSLSP